ncbi:GMP synthase [Nannizzia gypsea CBS 118893]|uniref:GMP synthase n=1 Tax=Arthroderma gypseum (strain ATCC MYA-4604 / CBS 118893) TaxID=535722 RepID=E4URL4_ARTGP|nr:GMP synthase [Nannizzia gypsea CBS 118893]EFR00224.1 GMP synthase [Nannizzia gypsea CBS 118893]
MRRPIRLAVLECDHPLPGTSAKYGGRFGGVFKSLLGRSAKTLNRPDIVDPEAGLDISEYDIVKNDVFPALEDIDAVLITGSKFDAFDTETPWINRLVEFIRKVVAQDRVRVIGICFGHQILGRVLGAKVGRSDVGWEAAVHPLTLTEKGKEVFGVEKLSIMEMHRDIVHDLPAGTVSLGSTPKCAIQGMYTPRKLFSVQGHPEFDRDIVMEIMQTRKANYPPEVFDAAMKVIDDKQDGVLIGEALLKFLAEE